MRYRSSGWPLRGRRRQSSDSGNQTNNQRTVWDYTAGWGFSTDGVYYLQAMVWDRVLHETWSPERMVIVDKTGPTVDITAPSHGGTWCKDGSVEVRAYVSRRTRLCKEG